MEYHFYLGKTKEDLDREPPFSTFSSLKVEQSGTDKYLGSEKDGVTFSFLNGSVLTQIDFYSKGYKGYTQFTGKLPKNLQFDMSQKDVQKKLGVPEHSQEPREIPVIGYIPAADSFNFGSYRILIRYSQTLDSLLMVTLTSEMN